MATFLPYASCYGNKQALQLKGINMRRFSLFLGTPPWLRYRRRCRARPTSELSLLQLTQLIRVLRQHPPQSPVEDPQVGSTSMSPVMGASQSCHSKSFRSRCLHCIYGHPKHTS